MTVPKLINGSEMWTVIKRPESDIHS